MQQARLIQCLPWQLPVTMVEPQPLEQCLVVVYPGLTVSLAPLCTPCQHYNRQQTTTTTITTTTNTHCTVTTQQSTNSAQEEDEIQATKVGWPALLVSGQRP